MQFTIMTGSEEKQVRCHFSSGGLDRRWRGYRACNPQPRHSCSSLQRATPSDLLYTRKQVTLPLCFANSLKTVSPCCPGFSQLSLLTTCLLQVCSTRAESQQGCVCVLSLMVNRKIPSGREGCSFPSLRCEGAG